MTILTHESAVWFDSTSRIWWRKGIPALKPCPFDNGVADYQVRPAIDHKNRPYEINRAYCLRCAASREVVSTPKTDPKPGRELRAVAVAWNERFNPSDMAKPRKTKGKPKPRASSSR